MDLFQTSTDTSIQTEIGQRFSTSDGREVVLVLTGSGTTVAPGLLYQNPALVSNHQNLVITAVTPADTTTGQPASITVTLGGTAATLNQYQLGYVIINDGTGEGQTLKVQGNPAQANTTGSLTLTLEDDFVVTPTTSSNASLIPATCNGVVIHPTTATNSPAGVGMYPIAASSYGFLQTKGICAGLADGTPAAGAALSPSNAVAGAFEGAVLAQGLVGTAVATAVDTEYRAIYINV